ncbi:rhodanese-like domain-containing protein [uncultured Thiodictyon sp.]|uniref:rhodanese-like domain-containing protein n=1 Tax=uncultured Thiodictyon sp. TaxID=1846217 RepID=UPI0025E8197F|nr:rhodanese-like domain-containing protein [uncultured Thiodictyon sp.]
MFHRQTLTLFAALLLTAGLAAAGPILTPPQAYDQAKAGTVTLIDVRTPAEWRDTGVPAGAVAIDMQDPKGPDGFAEAVLAQVHGDHAAPIAVICRSGNRSTRVQEALESRGFTNVANVKEGVSGGANGPGWLKRELPVTACKNC